MLKIVKKGSKYYLDHDSSEYELGKEFIDKIKGDKDLEKLFKLNVEGESAPSLEGIDIITNFNDQYNLFSDITKLIFSNDKENFKKLCRIDEFSKAFDRKALDFSNEEKKEKAKELIKKELEEVKNIPDPDPLVTTATSEIKNLELYLLEYLKAKNITIPTNSGTPGLLYMLFDPKCSKITPTKAKTISLVKTTVMTSQQVEAFLDTFVNNVNNFNKLNSSLPGEKDYQKAEKMKELLGESYSDVKVNCLRESYIARDVIDACYRCRPTFYHNVSEARTSVKTVFPDWIEKFDLNQGDEKVIYPLLQLITGNNYKRSKLRAVESMNEVFNIIKDKPKDTLTAKEFALCVHSCMEYGQRGNDTWIYIKKLLDKKDFKGVKTFIDQEKEKLNKTSAHNIKINSSQFVWDNISEDIRQKGNDVYTGVFGSVPRLIKDFFWNYVYAAPLGSPYNPRGESLLPDIKQK